MSFKILIVDDAIDNLQVIVQYLEASDFDCEILQALNAKVAFNIAEKELPDLVITDWDMPVINGIEFIQMLEENEATKNITVIMCTGVMTTSQNLKTALEAGAVDYIRKPIDEIELLARVRSTLELHNSHKEILDLKNRELAATALNIARYNEFNQRLLTNLKNINLEHGFKSKALKFELEELIDTLAFNIKAVVWKQFKGYFDNVHPGFLKRLTASNPSLTPAEIRLAYFLRLNLSTKEISSITFNSPNSIKTSRNRLRKKLGLEIGNNLVTYLLRI
jgi:DNA-binding response OmpR family regulator/DNA-binding CsgD family transcriptional regulator